MSAAASHGIELTGYCPGAIGWVARLHGSYYAEHWDLGIYFESKVAIDLSEFLRRLDPARDCFILARQEGEIVGSIAIDGTETDDEIAHLRWFIVDPKCQGTGVGNLLMKEALAFSRKAGHSGVYLWTFAGLDAARHLYEKFGFALKQELPAEQWGQVMTEQRFEIEL